MAELYVRQGHIERALEVYRDILAKNPNDSGAAKRLAELQASYPSSTGESMSFREHLQKAVEATPGALACTIMGFDGIAIDTYDAPGSELDLASLMAEFLAAIQQLQHATEELSGPDTFHDLTVASQNIAMVLGPGSLTGKARYMTRILGPRLQRELVI
jgi:hypothetical protein